MIAETLVNTQHSTLFTPKTEVIKGTSCWDFNRFYYKFTLEGRVSCLKIQTHACVKFMYEIVVLWRRTADIFVKRISAFCFVFIQVFKKTSCKFAVQCVPILNKINLHQAHMNVWICSTLSKCSPEIRSVCTDLWPESELNCTLCVNSRTAQVLDNTPHSDVKEVAASLRQSANNFGICLNNLNSLFDVSYWPH
jgi:hypothetical protein